MHVKRRYSLYFDVLRIFIVDLIFMSKISICMYLFWSNHSTAAFQCYSYWSQSSRMTKIVERGWLGQGRSWWKGGCQCTRGYMCVTLFQCVGQVSIVSLGWHQPKAINASFDWKVLEVICKHNTINRYKIKVFCLLI